MADTSTSLAALVGSRICHDLISPIGAINNGLELLAMSSDRSGPEMGLINESVGNASARIRFFRTAFGAAGDQMVGHAEVSSILRDLYDQSRLDVVWAMDEPVERIKVRLAFLALMCAETALPYGGRVEMRSIEEGGWQLHGSADRVNIDADLWGLLAGTVLRPDLPPSHVQFALFPLVARDSGCKIKLQSDEKTLLIRY